MTVLVFFPAAVIKYTDESNLKEKRFMFTYSSRILLPFVVGESRQQEPEAAGHLLSLARKKKAMNADVEFMSYSSYSQGSQTRGWFRSQGAPVK